MPVQYRGNRCCHFQSWPPCGYAERSVRNQRSLVGPLALDVAAEAAARLPQLKAFTYEGPHGDCRAAFAALRAMNLEVPACFIPTTRRGDSEPAFRTSDLALGALRCLQRSSHKVLLRRSCTCRPHSRITA